MKKGISLVCLLFVLLTLTNCKKEDSILKVFVRSASNQLINGAMVVAIGDQQSTPPTGEFVDTAYTNSSGFTTINLGDYFTSSDNTRIIKAAGISSMDDPKFTLYNERLTRLRGIKDYQYRVL